MICLQAMYFLADENVFSVHYWTGERRDGNDLKDRDCHLVDVSVQVEIDPRSKTIRCCGRPGLDPDYKDGEFMPNYCYQSTAICCHGYAVLSYLYLTDRSRLQHVGCTVVC